MVKTRRLRLAGFSPSMQEGRSALKKLTKKFTGKLYLRRPESRWEENVRIDLVKIDVNTRNWSDSISIGIIGEICTCYIDPSCSISQKLYFF